MASDARVVLFLAALAAVDDTGAIARVVEVRRGAEVEAVLGTRDFTLALAPRVVAVAVEVVETSESRELFARLTRVVVVVAVDSAVDARAARFDLTVGFTSTSSSWSIGSSCLSCKVDLVERDPRVERVFVADVVVAVFSCVAPSLVSTLLAFRRGGIGEYQGDSLI